MATPVKVKKWGSSLAVVIPSHFAKVHDIQVGSVLDIEPVHLVKPKPRRYKLAELMRGFKPEHRHGEWDTGGPVGKELL